MIVELHRKGKTVFFSSHVVPDIEEICDRVIFVEKGKLVYDGSVQSLIHSSPSSEFTIKVLANKETLNRVISKSTDVISSVDLGSGYNVLKVAAEAKQRVLSQLVQNTIEIISLEIDKPTLEEIFDALEKEKSSFKVDLILTKSYPPYAISESEVMQRVLAYRQTF